MQLVPLVNMLRTSIKVDRKIVNKDAKSRSFRKSFGTKQVLHQISFEIKRGHIVGLIGANGAGKTTIMKSILGITSFTGKIVFNGLKITADDHRALERVGALIEYPGLYPYLTGREQLTLFREEINLVTK